MDDLFDNLPSACSMQNGSTRIKHYKVENVICNTPNFDQNPDEFISPDISLDNIDECTDEFVSPDISLDNIDANREINMYESDEATKKEEEIQKKESENSQVNNNLKYHIMDLFWIINPNYQKNELREGEVDMVTVSFNMDFGNLRVAFYKIPNGALYNSTLFHQKLQRVTNASIYPSACFRVMSNLKKEDEFTCLEQLFSFTGEAWQKERPIVYLQKSETTIRVNIYDVVQQKNYFFDFENEQKLMFEHACNFVVTSGFNLVGSNVINK